MEDIRILTFDTESASLEGGVVELAIAEIDENLNIIHSVDSLIDPEREISPVAGGVHGIYPEDVADKPTLAEFAEVYGNPFDHPNLYLVGYNVGFDIRMVSSLLPQTYRKVDLLRLARNFWPENENHQLQTLAYQFRLHKGTAHRAAGDVVTTVSLLRFMADTFNLSFHELADLARKPLSLDSKITFGKHKGWKLSKLPLEYVNWLLNKSENLDPDLREALTPRLQAA